MPSAYLIANVDVTDPVQYEEYKRLSSIAMKANGAEVCIRGGKVEVLEGDWAPSRFVMLKFASVDRAMAFYQSVEYEAARKARRRRGCHAHDHRRGAVVAPTDASPQQPSRLLARAARLAPSSSGNPSRPSRSPPRCCWRFTTGRRSPTIHLIRPSTGRWRSRRRPAEACHPRLSVPPHPGPVHLHGLRRRHRPGRCLPHLFVHRLCSSSHVAGAGHLPPARSGKVEPAQKAVPLHPGRCRSSRA